MSACFVVGIVFRGTCCLCCIFSQKRYFYEFGHGRQVYRWLDLCLVKFLGCVIEGGGGGEGSRRLKWYPPVA